MVSKFLGSDEEDKHLRAELHRDWLIKAFTDMDSEGKALLELVPLMVPVPLVNEVEVYSCSKEKLVHRAHLLSLEKLIKSNTAVSLAATHPVVTDMTDTVVPSSPSYLKLKKLEARHFSGQRREYAAWKRDFCDVVDVPGRPAAEIGYTLKSCIPQRFLYLFDNLALSEHGNMMEILDEKFGKARFIIYDTVNEMEKMKPVSTDKEFIYYICG